MGQDEVVRTLGRLLGLALLAVLAAVLTTLVVPAPGSAHSTDGEMTVLAAEPSGPGAVRLEVGIVYASDGHLAEEATVTATLDGPEGAVVGPVDLPRIAGARYGAEVPLPAVGTWQVVFTSTGPAAQGTAVVDVPAAVATEPPSPDSPTTTTLTSTVPGTSEMSEIAVDGGEPGSGPATAVAVAAAVGGAALVGAILAAVLRGKRAAG